MISETQASPPSNLPADPREFWSPAAPPSLAGTLGDAPSALERLGPSPFPKPPKGAFPFLGFLATLYDHIAACAEKLLGPPNSAG
jgi:hypothetical protein